MERPNPDQIQARLLLLAGVFLCAYAGALTIAPAARARTWGGEYRWEYWLGVGVWIVAMSLAHHATKRRLPGRDPFLLPIAGLLTGWGLMAIWRVAPGFGLRQSIWLGIAATTFILGLRLPGDLRFLRRYKYLWLVGGLLLTGLTLVFGTSPSGFGPRLWFGCCGVYFQPSEPLKLLLIMYLAAYLAERQYLIPNLLPLLAPTLALTGIALLLLLVQRDLGTGSVLLFVYASTVYAATGKKRVPMLSLGGLVLFGVAGYTLFDVVRVRVDAWFNPWADPSGRSYQIMQSIIATASGGIFGRGPGLGEPGLVPVAHSDFIFTTIVEEMGLLGAIGLLTLVGLLLARGLRAALRAADDYHRYVAAGLTAHIVGQSILIAGGTLRLLPLTGVTFPFVSYGGSSLMVSWLALLFLLLISNQPEDAVAGKLPEGEPYLFLGGTLWAGLACAGLVAGWWGAVRSADLLARPDNFRPMIADRYAPRGSLVDRHENLLTYISGLPGEFTLEYPFPALGPVVGYSHPFFGQAGLQASLDGYLRGIEPFTDQVVWDFVLYGQHPPGRNVRLSLSLDLQLAAAELLGDQTGAVVLLNSASGEILVMLSQPGFDANLLDEQWETLLADERAPLLNRASQGQYQPGAALGPLLLAEKLAKGNLPNIPEGTSFAMDDVMLDCATTPSGERDWGALVAAGCPGPLAALGEQLGGEALRALFAELGLYNAPQILLPVSATATPNPITDPAMAAVGQADLAVSPLQLALAAATLNGDGVRPTPRIATAVQGEGDDWVPLAPTGAPAEALAPLAAGRAADLLATGQLPLWETVAQALNAPNQVVTWYLGGTLPSWDGAPVTLVVLLETDDPALALEMGRELLDRALRGE